MRDIEMRALFLTKYTALAATSRYRAHQYFGMLEQRGWELALAPLFPDSYLERLYGKSTRSTMEVAGCLLRRAAGVHSLRAGKFDVIYVQYECLPRIPWVFESGFYRRQRVVVDYDDAVHELYRRNRFLKTKIASVMSEAAHVIVGSHSLREYAAQFNRRVTVIPTVIDTALYRTRSTYQAGERFIVGWVGSPVTVKFLELLGGVLRSLSQQFPLTLRCLGVPEGWRLDGVTTENIPWSLDAERRVIPTFDVGVMPLPDNAFTSGKCGFKLIQYMGCGVPAIGSAVGANREIIHDGENGMLAEKPEEFGRKITALLLNARLRERLGRAGRRTIETAYSLSRCGPRFCDVLSSAVSSESIQSGDALRAAAHTQG